MYLLLIFFLILIIPFLVMPGHITAGKKSPYEAIVSSVLIICCGAVIVFMAASMLGKGVFSQLHDFVVDISKVAANDPMVIKALKFENLSAAERVTMVTKVYDAALKLLPSFIVMAGTIVSYIAYIILSKSLSKRSAVKLLPRFREFSFPSGMVLALIIMYMVSWLLTSSGTFSDNSFYVNIDVLFDFVFFIQGMSVVFMLFYVKRIPKAFALILSILMWYIFIGRTIFVMLGMLDLILGFKARMLIKNRK